MKTLCHSSTYLLRANNFALAITQLGIIQWLNVFRGLAIKEENTASNFASIALLNTNQHNSAESRKGPVLEAPPFFAPQ